MRLLVNNPQGHQELITVSEGGAYFDASRVVWDERVDGELPEITLGGMVRVEGTPGIEAVEYQPAVEAQEATEESEAIEAQDEVLAVEGVEAIPPSLAYSQEVFDAQTFPSLVPQVVTMAQARKAIILAGIGEATVDAAIAAIVDDLERSLALADWGYSGTVRRDSALVASLAPGLDLDDAELDQLFILADSQ